MFPNPQDALPLPARPRLEGYRKLAKALVQACLSEKEGAIERWASDWVGSLANRTGARHGTRTNEVEDFVRRQFSEKCSLANAHLILARSHGFVNWEIFSKHLEALARKLTTVSRFEAAAEAIVGGDIATVKRLLRAAPKLIRATSTREHRATLLHYTAANGVEGYRQISPSNIVEIAELLLRAGAKVDATADVYGGDCTTLGLAATSVHPERAGVQAALLQLLLDHGAQMESQIAGNKHTIIEACLANGRPKAAEFLASRGARLNLLEAVALGRIDRVKPFFSADGRLKRSASARRLNRGFLYACGYGRNEMVEFLLEKGMDLSWHAGDGQTPLHWASIGGQLETVKLMLRYHPPLEAVNQYGGTVWGQTLWSAAHGGDADTYIAILEALAAAGAVIGERHVPVNSRVDAWLAAHGSVAEPRWYWYGEKHIR
jgi:Ankyrin repeats (3 copies)